MAARQPSLKVGDRVSVETRVWGDNWAQSVHGDDWKAGRTYGKVVANDSAKWVCDFGEKDGKHASWQRSTLRFEKRAEEPPAPMTVEEVYAAATAEGLVLHASDASQTGYRCVVYHAAAGCRPFQVRVSKKRIGSFATAEEAARKQKAHIGSFATAEEAALCYARHVQENGVALPENAPKKRRRVVYQPGQNSMSAADALAACSSSIRCLL